MKASHPRLLLKTGGGGAPNPAPARRKSEQRS